MKMTLLEMVQDIMSSMNSDEVNSIGDTVESMQVAMEVRTAYFSNFGQDHTPTFENLFQLQNYSDPASPTQLVLPTSVKEMYWFRYNWHIDNEQDYREVIYLKPSAFIERCLSFKNQQNTVTVDFPGGIQLSVINNQPPRYFTTFDDHNIICDGFSGAPATEMTGLGNSGGPIDNAWTGELFDDYNTPGTGNVSSQSGLGNYFETTLEGSNTLAFGQFEEVFLLEDDFIPLMDTDDFPLFLSIAKNRCFVNIKQEGNQYEMKNEQRLRYWMQADRWHMNQRDYFDPRTNYGRRNRGSMRAHNLAPTTPGR